jgi:hypothetical protein
MPCIERLLTSRMFRRYVESWVVVLFPLVLLMEQPAETMDGRRGGYDEDLPCREV